MRPTFGKLCSLPERRQTTNSSFPSRVNEMPKTWELEQRVARLELDIQNLLGALDIQAKRAIALQAQLDHLFARLTIR